SPLQGLRAIPESAAELAEVVDDILATTGAERIDLVGHSQGGLMPRWYIRFLGGDATVDQLIALAPANHGTASGASDRIAETLPGGDLLLALGCAACLDQTVGSAFLTELNAGGDLAPDERVRHTVIASAHDDVVIPPTSS